MQFNPIREAKPSDFQPGTVFRFKSESYHHIRVIEPFGRGDFICVSELCPGEEIVVNQSSAQHYQLCEQLL